MYPGGLEIYQDRMPLYINCTEVTHVYTNGSYQLVYQNCTPLFVRTKQVFDNLDLSVHSFSRGNSKSLIPVQTAVLPFFLDPSNGQERWGETKTWTRWKN